MPLLQAVLRLTLLRPKTTGGSKNLENKDVFDAFPVSSWLKVIAARGTAHPLNLLLRRVVCVLHGNAGQVLAIALDLDSMANVKHVALAAGALLLRQFCIEFYTNF